MIYEANTERYENTPYERCGLSGLKLPKLSLGLWHNFGDVDEIENSRQLLRAAFYAGITHFDLANNYGPPPGSAERNFGRLFMGKEILAVVAAADDVVNRPRILEALFAWHAGKLIQVRDEVKYLDFAFDPFFLR